EVTTGPREVRHQPDHNRISRHTQNGNSGSQGLELQRKRTTKGNDQIRLACNNGTSNVSVVVNPAERRIALYGQIFPFDVTEPVQFLKECPEASATVDGHTLRFFRGMDKGDTLRDRRPRIGLGES